MKQTLIIVTTLLLAAGCSEDASLSTGTSTTEDTFEGADAGNDTAEAFVDTSAEDTTPTCVQLGCDHSQDTVCLRAACNPKSGTCEPQPAPEGTPCSDGDPCSVGDECGGGKCNPGKHSACECKTTDDCNSLEDGDACNGTLYCDTKLLPWRCKTLPASIVNCPAGADSCAQNVCDPATGDCKPKPLPDGAPCSDGQSCTIQDACKGGKCAGTQVCKCQSHADCALQEDDNLCNGTLYCDSDSNTCKLDHSTVVACSSLNDTACVKSACDAQTGLCIPKAVTGVTACDDGDSCTNGDYCNGGNCVSGKNTCACKADADCAKHDDGDKCNGVKFCDLSSGQCLFNPASVITCVSVNDTACAHNVCLPKEGACTMAARSEVTEDCQTTTNKFG